MITAYFFSTPLINYAELIKEQSMVASPSAFGYNKGKKSF